MLGSIEDHVLQYTLTTIMTIMIYKLGYDFENPSSLCSLDQILICIF